MRLLIINCITDRSEAALYLGLLKLGVEVVLILDPKDPVYESMRQAGIDVYQWTIRHRFDFRFDKKLKDLLAVQTFDAIYAPTSRGTAAALRVTKGSKIKLVTYRGTMGNLNRLSPLAYLAQLNPRIHAIICNCQAVKKYLISQNVKAEKLPVVYKGHDPSWYKPSTNIARAQLGIDSSAFVVGCIANMRALKGVDYLIKAIQDLRKTVPVMCLLVGQVQDSTLIEYVSKNKLEDCVKFLGFRSDVSNLLGVCDVTVMPSVRREGFPRAIVESFSAKIPVVCSAIGGMPEIVEEGVSGLVVPAANSQALANALNHFYSNPEFRVLAGKAGYEYVLNTLSVEKYAQQMLDVFM